MDIDWFEQGLESFFLLKDELMVAVCSIKYLEVSIVHPGRQTSVSIISVLSKGLKTSIKLWDYIREVELVDEVEPQDVFFVVL